MNSPTDLQLLPLHTHTNYSVLDGASSIDDYLKWCKDNGASTLGVTDHGWMIGASELVQKAQKAGIKPLPGCEFYVIPEVDYEFKKKPYSYYHVTVWAVTVKGYQNLLKLGSMSFREEKIKQQVYNKETKTYSVGMANRVVVKMWQAKPRITFSELLEHNEGLVLGSGCLIGSINKALLEGEPEGAERNLLKLLEVYRGRFFIELMPHSCTHDYSRSKKAFQPNECTEFSPDGDLQKACNLRNIDLASKHKLPLILTTDSHFVHPDQKSVQDVLLQNGDPDGWRFYNSYHALTTPQAWEHWEKAYGSDANQRRIFTEAVENNHHLAAMSSGLELQQTYHQPEITLPSDIQTLPIEDQLKTLIIRQIEKHGRMRWDDNQYTGRLAKELNVICDNGIIDFSQYFLFLEQWGRWTRDHSILSAPGRGSAAGSLVSYLLKITHLNPFEYNLPFERFLSPGRLKRGKNPDIDWDLGQRDILIAELSRVYGDKFAQCSVHGTLKIKSAIKDACRVIWNWNDLLDAPRAKKIAEVEAVTKTIPMTPTGVKDYDFLMGYTDTEGHIHEGHLEQNQILTKFFNTYPEVLEMVLKLLGIPRSVGRHASAYFISDRNISESVPTCSVSGHTCTQYTAVLAEKAGLVKFDFLRVNTLSDISGAIRLIQQRQNYKVQRKKLTIDDEDYFIWTGELPVEAVPMPDGRVLDIYNLPMDEEVFKDFDRGNTETVFQMHTPLLTTINKQIKPRSIADLSAIVALVRPGPATAKVDIDGAKMTMLEAYIQRRNGELPVTYPHPEMESILKETQGVAVYQEQLQQIFSDLAGYSSEEADEIRELIAKKKKQDMEKAIPEIRARLRARSWNEAQIQMLVDLCIANASYSFNKSHSASYAIVAYQCQFLKHYFPVEWWTSVLQNAKVDDIREKHYAESIKTILQLPHVNGPMGTFELIEGKVHAPLYLIDGIGKSACQAIEEERDKNGPYKDFLDFYDRIDKSSVDKGIFEAMILCGAFDYIQSDMKPQELWDAYCYFRRVQDLKIGRDKSGQALLDVVLHYQGDVEVSSLYQDAVELELKRMSYLPIYRMDCLERFKKLFEAKKFLYDETGKITAWFRNGMLRVLRNEREIPSVVVANRPYGFVGFLRDEAEEFTYLDKKSEKRVTASKFFLVNDGDALECVLWPNIYTSLGKPNKNRIIFANGIIKESREPGKYQMFVQSFAHI